MRTKQLLAATAISLLPLTPAAAEMVGYPLSGVTTPDFGQPSDLNTEYPAGTAWSVRVEWDSDASPLFLGEAQSSFRLTRLTLTLQGKSGPWTTSSLAGKPSFSLNQYGNTDEIQFTSGWGPEQHSNPKIGNWTPYSIDVALGDPTGNAISSLETAPTSIALADWSDAPFQTYFKFYLSNDPDHGTFDIKLKGSGKGS